MAEGLALEIVEGPGAGKQVAVSRPLLLGRAPDADLVLEDGEISRHHARVTPSDEDWATVEDLGSVNGTFVNGNELIGPARIDPGDELLMGVTLIQLRSAEDRISVPSTVTMIPPALATAPRPRAYVNPEIERTESEGPATPVPASLTAVEARLSGWRSRSRAPLRRARPSRRTRRPGPTSGRRGRGCAGGRAG